MSTLRKHNEIGPLREVYRTLNRLIDELEGVRVMKSKDVHVKRTALGTLLEIIPGTKTETPGPVKEYVIDSIGADTYGAHDADSGEVVTIAKPFELRKTPFSSSVTFTDENGATYTAAYSNYGPTTGSIQYVKRKVTIAASSYAEFQVIVPIYKPGFSTIVATTVDNGITGLPDVTLVDLNYDGRAWCREGPPTTP